MQQTQREQ